MIQRDYQRAHLDESSKQARLGRTFAPPGELRVRSSFPSDLVADCAALAVAVAWLPGSLGADTVRGAARRLLDHLSALASLADLGPAHVHRGPVRVVAFPMYGDPASPEDRALLEEPATRVNVEDALIALDPTALVAALLGDPVRPPATLWELFGKITHVASDGRSARGRLRRALHFWGRASSLVPGDGPRVVSVWDAADAFLACSTVLEVIAGSSNGGITDSISTRVAALASRDVERRIEHRNTIRKLYDLRSRYVHQGEAMIRLPELAKIRDYARTALLALLRWTARETVLASSRSQPGDEVAHASWIAHCDRLVFGGV